MGFQDDSFGAGPNALQNVMALGMHGEKDGFGLRRDLLNLMYRVQAIQERHSQIDQRHIGVQLLRQFHRLMTVPCLRRHLEALPFEKEFQALANERMVVCEKDLNGHLSPPWGFGFAARCHGLGPNRSPRHRLKR